MSITLVTAVRSRRTSWTPEVKAFCAELPEAGPHVHLEGALRLLAAWRRTGGRDRVVAAHDACVTRWGAGT